MPKEKKSSKPLLAHIPLGAENDPEYYYDQKNKSKNKRNKLKMAMTKEREINNAEDQDLQRLNDVDYEHSLEMDIDNDMIPKKLSKQIQEQAMRQRIEVERSVVKKFVDQSKVVLNNDGDDSDLDEAEIYEEFDYNDEYAQMDGEYINAHIAEDEDAIIQKFLEPSQEQGRILADIIINKIREKEIEEAETEDNVQESQALPSKVIEVYTLVGKMLQNYRTGKLPKALKMLPHLKNWEEVLWITRPDTWSPAATFACSRIFASNLSAKLAQRFFNIVLLEKCRDDIQAHKKLNYHLYMALKKSLFKPGAFYKGILLPLVQSRTCSLREATIIGSVIAKVSIPADHSAAALLKLATMPYSGTTSLFIKILINKRYALPRRVISVLVDHFTSFENESRLLPVVWHQALLAFAQRYKYEIDDNQRERLKQLMRVQIHHLITPEIRRELFSITIDGLNI